MASQSCVNNKIVYGDCEDLRSFKNVLGLRVNPKTHLKLISHAVYKGAILKDLTEQAELRSEWEPIRDNIKQVVELILLMQDITEGKKSDLTIHIPSQRTTG